MAWVMIVVAGLLEVAWAAALKASSGFSRLWPTVGFVVTLGASMVLLSLGVRSLPIGTAYAVWVGIGAAGAAVVGIVVFGESASPVRLLFLALLLVSIVGLKVTSGG